MTGDTSSLEWRARMTDPGRGTIHGAFREQARRAPAAPAVFTADRTLSYGELDRWSDDLAAQLVRSAGVGAGDRVPIVMGRSVELVATLLGVLKAGAAYAIMDGAWSQARLDASLRSLGADRVLGVSWPGGPAAWTPEPSRGLDPPPDRSVAEDPATVFFTSGTTGDPKGALVPHAGTVLLFEKCDFMRLDETTVMLQAAALPWDGLTLELWSALTTGGSVYLLDDGAFLDGAALRAAVRAGVNTAWLTASIFTMLVDEDIACFEGLRHVLTGGERLSPDHARRFLARHGDEIALTNGYGPAEATVFVTTHRVRAADLDGEAGVPLGTAVPATELVIERDGRPVEDGEIGELVVSGPRVGLGYVGRADPGGFRLDTTPRSYATGDLVSRRDGLFHFHGRADRQLKIRGHRVEPGEIERIAAAQPGVGTCALIPIRGESSGLVESLALVYTGSCTVDALRARLREKLPPALVPSRVVGVTRMPLTAHGKLDEAAVRALLATRPAPEQQTPSSDQPGPAPDQPGPADPAWATFLELTRDLLDGAPPTAHDTWWGLGGSSLDLMRLAIRASRQLDRDISVQTLATVESIGDIVSAIAAAPALRPENADADAAGPGDDRPLTDTQAGFLLQHAMDDDAAALSPMLWRINGVVDPAVLRLALLDVQQRHPALRSRYLLEPSPHATPASRSGVQLDEFDDSAGALDRLLDALHQPLDLEAGLVWRAVLGADGDTSVLGVQVHHIAFDGWSESVLARDLSTAYDARQRGQAPKWPTTTPVPRRPPVRPEPVRPELTAQWVRHLDGAADIAWREQPGESCDGDCPDSGHVAGRRLAAAPTQALRHWAAARGHSTFSLILAAFTRALAEHAERDDFLVGVPTRTRSSAEIDTIDCLINVFCLRTPSGVADWPDHLSATAEELRWCLPRSSAALRDIRLALNLPRTGRNPLYQVMFAYQDHPPATLTIGDDATYQRIATRRAPVELLLEVVPDADGGLDLVGSRQCEHVGDRLLQSVLDRTVARLSQL
jgi:mycobactin peptide synthetase MbtE